MHLTPNSPIIPMEPVLAHNVQDWPDFVYQVKWDGVRILCHLVHGQVWLWNKRLNQRTAQYPELQKAASLIKASTAILDGEVVVIKNQRPSFPGIMSRENSRKPASIKQLQQSLPVDYMIFDLIYLNDHPLLNVPLLERRNLLNNILTCEKHFHLVENFMQGTSLYSAVQKQGLEGIVAKQKQSLYIPGKSHVAWFKYKNRLQCHAVVGGFIQQGKQLKSLLLGLFRDDKLYYIGRASTGLNEEQRSVLMKELPKMRLASSPFAREISATKDTVFVLPVLTVWVDFAEWTEDLHLRSPVILGFSTHDTKECQLVDSSI